MYVYISDVAKERNPPRASSHGARDVRANSRGERERASEIVRASNRGRKRGEDFSVISPRERRDPALPRFSARELSTRRAGGTRRWQASHTHNGLSLCEWVGVRMQRVSELEDGRMRRGVIRTDSDIVECEGEIF